MAPDTVAGVRGAQLTVFALTFLCYASLHATRKSISNANIEMHEEWAVSFATFGSMDAAFLATYAVGLFLSGLLGDASSPKLMLVVGMFLSAVVTTAIAFAKQLGLASPSALNVLMAFSGAFQSTAWPNCVAIMAKWCPVRTRGMVLGIWGTNSNAGNILGGELATWIVRKGSGVTLIVGIPSAIVAMMALLILCCLRSSPTREEAVIIQPDGFDKFEDKENATIDAPEEVQIQPLIDDRERADFVQGAGLVTRFVAALKVSGVIEYSTSYVCKLYAVFRFVRNKPLLIPLSTDTLFFWLPLWLENGSLHLSKDQSDYVSTFYDVGGVIGGLIAGWLSDILGRRCPVVIASLLMSAVALVLLRIPGTDMTCVAVILAFCGALINGPATLITTAISADLGLHPSVRGRPAIMSTVAGIIDGTGSIGAAIGQLVVGRLSERFGVDILFDFLIPTCLVAALCLVRRIVTERNGLAN